MQQKLWTLIEQAACKTPVGNLFSLIAKWKGVDDQYLIFPSEDPKTLSPLSKDSGP